MLIVKMKKDKVPRNDGQNYLWNHDDKYTIIINQDKVSHQYKKGGTIKYRLGKIDIESKTLTNIIDESLKTFPRKYILSLLTNRNNPLGKQNFERILNEIFEPEGKKVTVDILRSVYITHFYESNPTLLQREKLAKQMRNSVSVQEKSYRKIIKPKEDEVEEVEEGPKIKKKSQSEPTKKKYFNLKEYMKEYRGKNHKKIDAYNKEYVEKNRDKVYRNKILRELNVTGNVKYPRKETIDKYNLEYDEIQDKWL